MSNLIVPFLNLKARNILLAFFLFILSNISFATEKNVWKVVKNKNGIETFSRKTEGRTLKDFRAVMLVDVSPEKLIQIITDFSKNTQIIPKCTKSKLVAKISDNEYYAYMVMKAPLVKDRDICLHLVIEKKKEGIYLIHLTPAPDYVPLVKEYVRIREYGSTYAISKMENKTLLVLETFCDPGPGIPDFIVNWASVDVPFDIFTNLKNYIQNLDK